MAHLLASRPLAAVVLAGLIGTAVLPSPAAATPVPVPPPPNAAVNRFAVDLYGQVRHTDGNLAVSPLSVVLALGLVHAGARGQTADDLERVLYLPDDAGDAQAQLVGLQRQLDQLARPVRATRMTIASGAWFARALTPGRSFRSRVTRGYHAQIKQLDFAASPDRSRRTINTWIDRNTGHHIKDLLPAGVIDASTQLVLANAIYFTGAWRDPFHPRRTSDGTFTTAGGQQIKVPFMRRTGAARGTTTADARVLELPYTGNRLVMDLVVPTRGSLAELEATLSPAVLHSWVGALTDLGELDIELPRFTIRSPIALTEPLGKLGLGALFGGGDLSGMTTGSQRLEVSDALHQAWIQVDEHGTKAAAATAAMVKTSAGPPRFAADRAFLFIIRDTRTGAILFMGRVADPR